MSLVEILFLAYISIDFLAALTVGVVIYRNRRTLPAKLLRAIQTLFGVNAILGRLSSIEDTLGYFRNRRELLDAAKAEKEAKYSDGPSFAEGAEAIEQSDIQCDCDYCKSNR